MKINLASVTSVNGKNLTQPEMNLLASLATLGLDADDTITAAGNPHGGYSVPCDPIIAALCKFVHVSYATYAVHGSFKYLGKRFPVKTFDRVRYLVLRLDSATYSAILD